MSALQAGLTAIRANQAAINTIAQNIANANTPGYHRQTVDLRARQPLDSGDGLLIGDGVDVVGLRQIRNQALETAVSRNTSSQAANATELGIVRSIETLVTPVDGSLSDRVQEFFNSVERLSSSPGDFNLRQELVGHAVNLSNELNSVATSLDRLAAEATTEIDATAAEINDLTTDLAKLNKQIRIAENGGGRVLGLRDQRDQLIGELSTLIDVELRDEGVNRSVALLGSNTVLVGENGADLKVSSRDGQLIVTQSGIDRDVRPAGGRLLGLLESHNRVIPSFTEQLDSLARQIAGIVDAVHSEGVGLGGSFKDLTSIRPVSSVDEPLADSVSGLPIQSGELFITVTNSATGIRTLERITIDPLTESLQDLAATITGLDNVTATVAAGSGQLAISAAPGFTFDFTGRLEQFPGATSLTGTSAFTLNGQFQGESNDQLTVSVVGSGTVGVDTDLTAEVRDSSGALLKTLDIGRGYSPGTELSIGQGLAVSFDTGSVNAGDVITFDVVADPDTSNVLAALGLNTLFSGTTAGDLAVADRILADPSAFAASLTGATGDSDNLLRLIDQRGLNTVNETGTSPEQFLADIVAESGRRVNDLEVFDSHLTSLGESYAAERESISGVSPDEEMLNLLKFQRSFQAAARLIATVNQTLDEILRIVG
jgi:flagellar hook-associated protein FlgK